MSDLQDLLDLQVFLVADYSQIEIRMLAEISGDPLLIEQFNSGIDIHCQVGHTLTGWSVDKIKADRDTRTTIKSIHFGIVFGLGDDGMFSQLVSQGVKITLGRVRFLHKSYFNKYKGVDRYIRRMRAFVEAHGYVETLFGPFRREIYKNDPTRSTFWGNQSINTPIQGTAHQLVLMALALLKLKPKTYNLLQKPVMEVHDSLYFYVRLGDILEGYKQIKHLLEQGVTKYAYETFGYKLRVPLIAEAKSGFCLGSLVEFNGQPIGQFLESWRKKHNEVETSSWDKLIPGFSKDSKRPHEKTKANGTQDRRVGT